MVPVGQKLRDARQGEHCGNHSRVVPEALRKLWAGTDGGSLWQDAAMRKDPKPGASGSIVFKLCNTVLDVERILPHARALGYRKFTLSVWRTARW
jgi:hypothetical protein